LSAISGLALNVRGSNPGNYRLQGISSLGIIVVSHMKLCKEKNKASIFIEAIDKDLYIKNNYHIYLPIIGGLYGGAMFVIAMLIVNCRD
jgi:hypothetical protein